MITNHHNKSPPCDCPSRPLPEEQPHATTAYTRKACLKMAGLAECEHSLRKL